MRKRMIELSNEEIKKIIEAIAEAYEKAGKKITSAIKVNSIEDDKIEGGVLIGPDKEDLN
jgi:hypothetical protein